MNENRFIVKVVSGTTEASLETAIIVCCEHMKKENFNTLHDIQYSVCHKPSSMKGVTYTALLVFVK